jgi:DNA-binding transcriptional LysR family regulator
MTLGLRELEVFRSIMELGSVTAAAAALNISQPAVSRMLQQAESRLGFPLFLRQKKRLLPTAEAEALLPETLDAFAAIDTVLRRAKDLREGRSGILNIAAIAAFANALLPESVQRFQATRPDVTVTLLVFNAQDVARRVASHRADLGVIIDSVAIPGTSVSELCVTEFGCILPRRHPLARKSHVTPADLERERLIGLSPHLPLGAQASRVFADANVPLRLAIEVSQSTVACALVRAGAGVALLDGLGFTGAPGRDLVMRPFRPAIRIVARLVQPRHRPLSRLAQEFVPVLDAVLAHAGLRPRPLAGPRTQQN